ncbi:MAG: twin-arginine translocase TatA/TatE family subunit [Gemmatimonadota bacterium]
MGNLGIWEILLIMVVVLLVFGAKRLPEVGGSIGKGIREFKRSLTDTSDAIMGNDDPNRSTIAPRHMDAPPQTGTPQNSGEPKRLSE